MNLLQPLRRSWATWRIGTIVFVGRQYDIYTIATRRKRFYVRLHAIYAMKSNLEEASKQVVNSIQLWA
eukprot:5706779-Pyramimonas_sp.AAC.1